MLLFGEFLVLAVGFTMLDQAVGAMFTDGVISVLTFVAVLVVVDVYVSDAITTQKWPAEHARILLITQVPTAAVALTGLVIAYGTPGRPASHDAEGRHQSKVTLCTLGLAVFAVLTWIWAWFQAHTLVSDIRSDDKFGVQKKLGMPADKGLNAQANHIIGVTFGASAWIMAVALVIIYGGTKYAIKRRRFPDEFRAAPTQRRVRHRNLPQ